MITAKFKEEYIYIQWPYLDRMTNEVYKKIKEHVIDEAFNNNEHFATCRVYAKGGELFFTCRTWIDGSTVYGEFLAFRNNEKLPCYTKHLVLAE